MAVSREEIVGLYREHLGRPFPLRLRGGEIGGSDLVMLDADIAGCVSTWLNSRHDLDPQRLRILRACLDTVVHRVVPALADPTERHYYSALGYCAQAVLAAQQDSRS